MKNKKIIIIAIFIIIVIIFASLYSIGYKVGNISKINSYIKDMELLEEKVKYLNSEYLLWEDYNPNEAGNFSAYLEFQKFTNANSGANIYVEDFQEIIKYLNEKNLENWNPNLDQILSNYCYFTPEDLSQRFNIENINYYLIVNFYTGNIICKNGIKYNGETYFRHYDLKENLGITNYQSDIVPEIEVVENNGLNKKIKIFFNNQNDIDIAEVYYLIGNDDEDKKRCSDLFDYQYITEEKAVYFTINISGNYEFIVEDTKYMQYPKASMNIVLCNKPILEEGMTGIFFDNNNNEVQIENIFDKNWYNYSESDFRPAYAKKDGQYWVWVPRFIYRKVNDNINIDFVYNISKTSTNNKSIINYSLPKVFENDVSGIWIREENLNYYNLKSADFFQKVLTNQ